MHDAARSYRRRYNHRHPTARRARKACLDRSNRICQGCGEQEATEGHHWTYPPEEETTAAHLTAFCRNCHDLITWAVWFFSVGGSRDLLGEVFPVFLARLLDLRDRPEPKRIGRALRVGHAWGAVVSGMTRPRTGEVVEILLRCSRRLQDVVVLGVVDGRPGSWRVRTRWLNDTDEVRPICVTDIARRNDRRSR